MALLYDDNYYKNVEKDIKELRKEYPFTKIVAYPYAKPTKIELKVIAVNSRIIRECNAQADDFKGEFSKEIKVIIPFDYKNRGCDIYGGSWFDIDKIPFEDRHFYETPDCDYQFCLGVPQSFKSLRNVVLENVKTAEQMLFAYESYQQGLTDKVKLISYSHGKKGMDEYERNKKRYRAK